MIMASSVHHSCRNFCDQWKRNSHLPPSAGSYLISSPSIHRFHFCFTSSESASHITRYLHMFGKVRRLSICSYAILMRSRLKIAIVLEFGTPSNDVAIRLNSTVWVIYTFRITSKTSLTVSCRQFCRPSVMQAWVLISRHRLADSFSWWPSLHVLYLKSEEKINSKLWDVSKSV